ncbi:MAG: alpha/beta hydrolase [Ketobacter sp.]|nr:MAG: alpha/beta hydrolase [Ketobacter sp.]
MSEANSTVTREDLSIELVKVNLSLKSRFKLGVMKLIYRKILGFILRAKPTTIAWFQLKTAGLPLPVIDGVPIYYDVIGRSSGHCFGNLKDSKRPAILWLHGGAFILPASPTAHHPTVGKLCQKLRANAFMPDYRLAPFNPFPAGLNDCEQAYRELLDLGYPPSQIVMGGDSAGANLVFGLLQRIRKSELPMPACAVSISPVTELGRVQGPPSRTENQSFDALIPASGLASAWQLYGGNQDSSDPEISPLFMDCRALPPLLIVAGAHEILRDDAIFMAQRCHAAGVSVKCRIWERLPHAFPLFANVLPEGAQSFEDINEFFMAHLGSSKATTRSEPDLETTID